MHGFLGVIRVRTYDSYRDITPETILEALYNLRADVLMMGVSELSRTLIFFAIEGSDEPLFTMIEKMRDDAKDAFDALTQQSHMALSDMSAVSKKIAETYERFMQLNEHMVGVTNLRRALAIYKTFVNLEFEDVVEALKNKQEIAARAKQN